MPPVFPEFKSIEISDRHIVTDFFQRYRPQTSELTFTNLFIWRAYFGWEWSTVDGFLIFIAAGNKKHAFALPPVGDGPRTKITRTLLTYLEKERGVENARVERADRRLVEELSSDNGFIVDETREHFDYVYAVTDLINLAGRKYHSKRNFINRFRLENEFSYETLNDPHIDACLDLADEWCRIHRCSDDLSLSGEHDAVREALINSANLGLFGGVITIDGRVRAFSLGETLSDDTAVVHVEKADPGVRGLYAVINQQFCEHALSGFSSVNREQDLGDEGLRKAKESYYPLRLVEKYRVGLG